jgi:hypothetical protein
MILCSQLKKMFDFIYTMPELRVTLVVANKDIVHIQIFGPQQLVPEVFSLSRVKNSPNPFNHQGCIEIAGVDDSKPSLVFWSAHLRPIYPMIAAFIQDTFPEEPC